MYPSLLAWLIRISLRANNTLTTSTWPSWHATNSGVAPLFIAWLICISFLANNTLTTSTRPYWHAKNKAVIPLLLSRLICTPVNCNRYRVKFKCPYAEAIINIVTPSSSICTLTSMVYLWYNSLTAPKSPFFEAMVKDSEWESCLLFAVAVIFFISKCWWSKFKIRLSFEMWTA